MMFVKGRGFNSHCIHCELLFVDLVVAVVEGIDRNSAFGERGGCYARISADFTAIFPGKRIGHIHQTLNSVREHLPFLTLFA